MKGVVSFYRNKAFVDLLESDEEPLVFDRDCFEQAGIEENSVVEFSRQPTPFELDPRGFEALVLAGRRYVRQ